ncbi:MAG TPA: DEAD/DEAH box helicase, partial [Acidimicrobiales bacterium]|nr:DEAD/DEAH box helicase [Acidimicrobiales bacterium]
LDEASSIDQPLAAPALLRARRAVIVGDPHQLRHVSFLSDAKTAQAVAASGLDGVPGLASRLDVRRNSIFDVATGTAPVTMLDEHFRSAPPLIDWAARRIYDGCLLVATRTPASEGRACIQIDHVTGERNASGVVVAEVDEVTKILHNLAGAKARSVGVVSPFRAQADALEGAVLAAFSADDVEGMDLRVGTVHAFQGNERDVVVASLGVGRNAAPNAWEFVAEPHLFTVLVTRARSSFRIVTSADPPADSLIADYFRQADSPPGRPHRSAELDPWSLSVHDHLVAAGLDVTVAYPVGRHTVDLCVKTLAAPVSVECRVHPAGADAHIERHLDLMRSGWLILDAYRSKWEARPGELAVELLGCLKPAAAH